jgi:hypothetical protein
MIAMAMSEPPTVAKHLRHHGGPTRSSDANLMPRSNNRPRPLQLPSNGRTLRKIKLQAMLKSNHNPGPNASAIAAGSCSDSSPPQRESDVVPGIGREKRADLGDC